jgi:hypothetical protein
VRQTTFAKEVAFAQNGDYRFFSVVGHNSKLDLAFLDIKNGVRWVPLREHNLIFVVSCGRSAFTDLAKVQKDLGIEGRLVVRLHDGSALCTGCAKLHFDDISDIMNVKGMPSEVLETSPLWRQQEESPRDVQDLPFQRQILPSFSAFSMMF